MEKLRKLDRNPSRPHPRLLDRWRDRGIWFAHERPVSLPGPFKTRDPDPTSSGICQAIKKLADRIPIFMLRQHDNRSRRRHSIDIFPPWNRQYHRGAEIGSQVVQTARPVFLVGCRSRLRSRLMPGRSSAPRWRSWTGPSAAHQRRIGTSPQASGAAIARAGRALLGSGAHMFERSVMLGPIGDPEIWRLA